MRLALSPPATLILGPVSYIDCLAFCVFLTPQLLWHVGLFDTVCCVLRALPFLFLELPRSFVADRFLRAAEDRPVFVRRAAPFADFVIRCVRYAFANIDPGIGRVFFSKHVALPFLRFRLLRHGYFVSPVHWREYNDANFRGLWVIADPMKPPDIVVFYAHGGGFVMGSSYFYLEFLLSWLSTLAGSGYRNPAIFSLDYTLAPEAAFPTQLKEAAYAYEHVLAFARDPFRVVVSGDSAGAAIILSLLLYVGRARPSTDGERGLPASPSRLARPGMAVLISPWATLDSRQYQNTPSDYLDSRRLAVYSAWYAGGKRPPVGRAPLAPSELVMSPGDCRDVKWWKRASPAQGFVVTYGGEEVFAPEIQEWIDDLQGGGVDIRGRCEAGGIHAWPVASIFLCNSTEERIRGLKGIVEEIRKRIPPSRR